jgi:hypothetical protein
MKSKAPWTPEEVDRLNRYQKAAEFHPFTCPGDKPGCQDQRALIATTEGWVCKCGEYRQAWAHADMVKYDIKPWRVKDE